MVKFMRSGVSMMLILWYHQMNVAMDEVMSTPPILLLLHLVHGAPSLENPINIMQLYGAVKDVIVGGILENFMWTINTIFLYM